MKKIIKTSLLFILKENKILLGQKKRGFGKGLYNGFGGKMQDGETIFETMRRETIEELSVVPISAELVGKIEFDLYINGENANEIVHIFTCSEFEGEVTESDEMKPIWFDLNEIPYENMFDDDLLWLPLVLKGEKVSGVVNFDKNNHTIFSDIKVVESLKL